MDNYVYDLVQSSDEEYLQTRYSEMYWYILEAYEHIFDLMETETFEEKVEESIRDKEKQKHPKLFDV